MRRAFSFGLAFAALFVFDAKGRDAFAVGQDGPSLAISNAITRDEVLQIAATYVNYPWRASTTNIFHGVDSTGVRVDTPDREWWGRDGWHADGRTNVGVPYCWGGADTLQEFDRGISEGRPAGHTFKKNIRPAASELPVGVDCSGFVMRCWKLDERRNTGDLAGVCRELESFEELQPGDAINLPFAHVVLFKEWLDAKHNRMRVIEAADPKVREKDYATDYFRKRGFVPLRYSGIAD